MSGFLSLFRRKRNVATVVMGEIPRVEYESEDGIKVFPLPADPNSPEYAAALKEVSEATGFPVDLLLKMIALKGMTSIRTSEDPIPRDSLSHIYEGVKRVLGAFKSTSVGSKSSGQHPGAGKVLFESRFSSRPNDIDYKDNNSQSQYPPASLDRPFTEISPAEIANLNRVSGFNIQGGRIYNGLRYYQLKVPVYDSNKKVLLDGKTKVVIDGVEVIPPEELTVKHYCQEAESFRTIFSCIDKGIYANPEIIVSNDGKSERNVLQFTDKRDPVNIYRVYLDGIVLESSLQFSSAANKAKAKFSRKGFLTNYAQLKKYVEENNFQTSHLPIFALAESKNTRSVPARRLPGSDFIPVLVQTGDNGEAIIRDSDFEHFYTPPLLPALAFKSFNGSKDTSAFDHKLGLRLLALRLRATNRDEFKSELNKFINAFNLENLSIDLHTALILKEQGVELQYKKDKALAIVNFSELPMETKQKILMAKYNDLSTLQDNMPFINYNRDDYAEYIQDVNKAITYYANENNALALKNCGQSSLHDLVFLHKLGHPMAMHGDEAGHPKAKPEKFARITTFVNGTFYVSDTEEQYLHLLFSNPELLDKQIMGVHPFWLRQTDETSGPRTELSNAWLDFLVIQALKQGILMSNEAGPGANISPLKGFEIFAQTMLLNMEPKIGDDKAQAELQVNIQLARSKFDVIRQELRAHEAKTRHPEELKLHMATKVSEIYSNSKYNGPITRRPASAERHTNS